MVSQFLVYYYRTGESGSPSPAISKSKSREGKQRSKETDVGGSSNLSEGQESPKDLSAIGQASSEVASMIDSVESTAQPDELILDEAAIELALTDITEAAAEKSSSIDGDDEVAEGDDWAEEEKKLREENR
jgi:hypothetical protein